MTETKALTKKNDFVEIEFTGKANGEIFDTTSKEKAKEINPEMQVKPLTVCIGQEMVVKGFDAALADKEIGKKYNINLEAKDAFGKRNPGLIKTIPVRVFREQNINPVPGLMLNLDGMIAKILSISGGRIMTDFNNPLAGKDIEYEFTITKKVNDEKDKVDSLQEFFFKKKFEFTIEEKRIVFQAEAEPFVQLFGKKLNEILGKEIEVKAKKDNKKEKEQTSSVKHNTEK